MLAPGASIGILGGGQLGRMLSIAAARYGLKTHVFCPDDGSPAFDVAHAHTVAAYEDEVALAAFAESVDVITYEFENVPAATAAFLAGRRPLRPGLTALSTAQDRLVEKSFVAQLGIGTAPFAAVDSVADLEAALTRLGRPAVLKTRRMGYDGKGQAKIGVDDDAAAAFAAIGCAPAILEGFVSFAQEISVIAAFGDGGTFAAFDVCENTHRDHILDVTRAPATIAPATRDAAMAAVRAIGDALGYVGVLTVELFVLADGATLLVNELAPRVHNSGHWTIEGAVTSQFAQHVRAIAGWPLGDAASLGQATMTNLVGDDIDGWLELLREPGVHLHLYGKGKARPGRKMGHVTRVTPRPA
ncbi:5-(carboxyamino)imidazole ribonucleotide synthase [Chelatococcus reniformis]|uniref:N5-carboxyaminoimidazole ribonucleotide synthase n=1 Tax=Chelatococcus reniformis TaxID=1494448 RepID=A0A916U847_9HYPH|nr:5-(carboxyamino)imidazole ribonucleotide synthase [Chelatococcus reniformis]GGC64091.1 N5-carboxyaminoimidazole ribonucleotide synthase [Chelatococcus reniformis]